MPKSRKTGKVSAFNECQTVQDWVDQLEEPTIILEGLSIALAEDLRAAFDETVHPKIKESAEIVSQIRSQFEISTIHDSLKTLPPDNPGTPFLVLYAIAHPGFKLEKLMEPLDKLEKTFSKAGDGWAIPLNELEDLPWPILDDGEGEQEATPLSLYDVIHAATNEDLGENRFKVWENLLISLLPRETQETLKNIPDAYKDGIVAETITDTLESIISDYEDTLNYIKGLVQLSGHLKAIHMACTHILKSATILPVLKDF